MSTRSASGPRAAAGDPDSVAGRVQLEHALLMNGDSAALASTTTSKFRSGTTAPKSVTSSLSRKDGLLRRAVYGGRAEGTARCVVGPAPASFDVDEVGVPQVVANALTRPIVVTRYNLDTLARLVRETSRVRAIVSPEGVETCMDDMRPDERAAVRIAPGWTVHRCLQDGDLVIVNRYPSLHQGSWMSHRVRCVPGFTIRLPPDATSPYNADFDGDEMNLHDVQTPEAYAELKLMRANLHVISPQNHAPLLVGIQNAPLGLWMLTRQGCTFGEARAAAIAGAFQRAGSRAAARAEPPALLAPARRWTGKQLVSMALPPSLHAHKRARSAIANRGSNPVVDMFPSVVRVWPGAGDPGPRPREVDDVVVVHRGHIVSGRVDKKVMYGPVSVMHGVAFREAPQAMAASLSEVSRVAQVYVTHFLQHTIGLADVMPPLDTERRVAAYGRAFLHTLREVEAAAAGGRAASWRVTRETERLVGEYLGRVVTLASSLADAEAPLGRSIRSGCKGSAVNRAQFCSMGQQTSFGARPSLRDPAVAMLPSFAPGDTSATPLGLVLGGIATGLQPEELWAACKAGRAALINTAVGTRKSGGLQRIVARGEQGVTVAYDGAVCTPAGHLIDLSYGHDNSDPTRLVTVRVPWVNAPARELFAPLRSPHPGPDPARPLIDFLVAARGALSSAEGEPPIEVAALPFLPSALLAEYGRRSLARGGAAERWSRAAAALYDLVAALRALHPGAPPVPTRGAGECGAIPLYPPHLVLDGTLLAELHPARLEAAGVDPADLEPGGALRRHLEGAFVSSRVVPGSPVGYIAAYAKGERQTQQTLNDFHFAGVQQAVGSVVARAEELLCATATKIPIARWAWSGPVAVAGPEASRRLAATLPCTTMRDVVADSWIVPTDRLLAPAAAGRPGLGAPAAALLQAHRQTEMVDSEGQVMNLGDTAFLIELDVGECRERGVVLAGVAARVRGFMRDPRAVVLSSRRPAAAASGGALPRWFLAVVPITAPRAKPPCMDAVAHALLHELIVSGVPGVSSAATGEREVFERDPCEGRLVARAHPFAELRGKGLEAARDLHGVLTDFRRCTTSCVHETQSVLGVAAARVVYMRELSAVLSSSGFISPRHLMISAGVQFCRGMYMGIADQGRGINSIIMRAIQAKPVSVFSSGAFVGEVDALRGPSAAVVGGRMAQGTGAAEVVPLSGASTVTEGLDHVSFRIFSPRAIIRRSVVRVTSKDTYAPDGSPVPGGLMDARFGSQQNIKCGTCLRDEDCIPHMGHYELARPIYPFFLKQAVVHALRCICPACGRIKVFTSGPHAHAGLGAILREPARRRLRALAAVCDRITRCPHVDCKLPQPHYRPVRAVVERTWPARTVWDDPRDRDALTVPLSSQEVFDLFDGIPRSLSSSLMGLHPSNRLSDLMVTVLPIPSSKTRPFARGGVARRRCDDFTLALQRIIGEDQSLRRAIAESGRSLWQEPSAGMTLLVPPRRARPAPTAEQLDAAETLSQLIESIETMTSEFARSAPTGAIAPEPAAVAGADAAKKCAQCDGRRQRFNETTFHKGICHACSHGICQGASCGEVLKDPSWTFTCELCERRVGGTCSTRCCKVTWPDTQTCICRKCATLEVLHGLMRAERAMCAGPCGRPLDVATGADARKWLMRATARGIPWRIGASRTVCLECSATPARDAARRVCDAN